MERYGRRSERWLAADPVQWRPQGLGGMRRTAAQRVSFGASGSIVLARECQAFVHARHRAIELLLVYRAENFSHARPGLDAERQQVASEDERRRRRMLYSELTRALEKPIHRRTVEAAASTHAIRFRNAGEELQVYFLRQAAERPVRDRRFRHAEHPRLQVMRGDTKHLLA